MRTSIWRVAVAVGVMFAGMASAATPVVTWNGGTGSWETGSNWSGGVAPSGGIDVRIDGGNSAASVVSLGTTTTIEALTVDAGDTLNLATGFFTVNAGGTINGTVSISGGPPTAYRPGPNQTIDGSGTFQLLNGGVTVLTADSMTIGSSLTVRGSGAVGSNGTFTNNGHLIADQSGQVLRVRGWNLINNGTIEATRGGIVALDGTMTSAGLGNIVNNGGTIRLGGISTSDAILNNSSATLTSDATADWVLAHRTFVQGGVMSSTAGHDFVTTGEVTLDGVTLNGRISGGIAESKLNINNGLTGSGSITLNGTALRSSAATPMLEIGSAITVDGTGGIGGSGSSLIHGTVNANVATKSISLTGSVVVDGTIQIRQGSRVSCNAFLDTSLAFEDGGHLFVELGSPSLAALAAQSLDLTSSEDYLDLVKLSAGNGPFLVATYTSLSGTFEHVTDGFTVDYATPGKVFVTAVPEPSVVWVAAGAIMGMGRWRRRNGYGMQARG